jgi:hypothetical protein
MSESAKQGPSTAKQEFVKKPYHPPVLVDYGSVAKLTRNVTGTQADNTGGFMRGPCL